MKVIKRDGRQEDVSFDKVLRRLQLLASGVHKNGEVFGKSLDIDVIPVCQKVISMITDGITTTELDEYAAATCANLVKSHPDYADLASRITVSNHQKSTISFVATMKLLYSNKDKQGKPSPLLNTRTYKAILENADELSKMIDDSRDFLINYFGFKTLQRSYLIKSQNGHQTIQERPQHMYMRVAVGLHANDLEAVKETYDLLSTQKLSHASPTLFNCGTPHSQLSSCFHEDTEVFTMNEGVKKIKDVKIGDEVVTHTGSVKKVVQLHKNQQNDRKIYKVVCSKTKDILVTDNHKFWSKKRNQKEPTWNAIKDLSIGDHIAIPSFQGKVASDKIDLVDYAQLIKKENDDPVLDFDINFTETSLSLTTLFTHGNLNGVKGNVQVSRESNSINRFLEVDEDLAELFGIFLGDGNIMTARSNRKGQKRIIRGLNFTFTENNKQLIDFVQEIGSKKFGIKGVYHKIKNQNTAQVIFHSRILGIAFKEMFGIHFNGKKLWNRMNSWNSKMLDRFVAGLISTDGCVTKDGQITMSLSNYQLLNGLYHLLRNHGYDVSFQKKKTRPKLATCDVYDMRVPAQEKILLHVKKYYTDDRMMNAIDKCNNPNKNRNQHDPIIISGQKFIRINQLEETDKKFDFVYTLGVEDDHSYNVEGLVCENCFLSGIDDSLDGIYTALHKNAMISKFAGGIGIWVHRIRAAGSKIRGTNGKSDGLIPMLRVFNETARYVNQGGKRKGSIAVYLEPHHADIEDFLDMKKTHGNMNRRCLDLFPAMWISDLFMKRLEQSLKNNEDRTVMWSLFCPDEAPNLEEAYGDDYEKLYLQYENERRYQKQVPIIDLWKKILDSQMETGIPYIGYKDPVNYRNNQMNIGTVKSSNLCIEIVLVNDPKNETISVCNLAAVPLGSFVKTHDQNNGKLDNPYFDFDELANSVKVAIQNLNKIIDLNFYPVKDCENSNFSERPVGLGVAGLYDAFIKMRFPFESDEAKQLNIDIFECMYYHACKTSMELAKQDGPYPTFKGSPASQGKLQFDLWNEDRRRFGQSETKLNTDKYDWDQLKQDIQTHGLRNSHLLALMPTASTAQIVGQTESFECMTYNLYKRQVLSGDFKLINHYLQKDLMDRGLWSDELADALLANRGSVQSLPDSQVPKDLKELYKGAFEIKGSKYLDLAIDRSAFLDQTQSLNIFVKDPNYNVLSKIQMYAWRNRLKTGQYYLRAETKVDKLQATIRPQIKKGTRLAQKAKQQKLQKANQNTDQDQNQQEYDGPACSRDNPDCLACQV